MLANTAMMTRPLVKVLLPGEYHAKLDFEVVLLSQPTPPTGYTTFNQTVCQSIELTWTNRAPMLDETNEQILSRDNSLT